jgi:pilus assembly protein TadC
VAAVFMLTNNILSLFVAVTVALGAFFLPLVLLQLLADTMKLKIKKVSLDFLITLKNFFITGEKQDIVNALKKTSKYVSEPLKTYLEIFSYEHEHRINPLMCLDNLIMRIDVNELKMYLENMKICFVFGGDVVALTDTFIEEISEMQNIEEQEDVEDKILNMGLYLLLLLNFGVVFFVLNSGTRIYFTENIAGQIVLVLNILISFVIIYTTIKEVGG